MARAVARSCLCAVDKHVHGQHPDHLGDDEGQGPEVEGPAVGVTILWSRSGGVPIGRYVTL